MIFTSANYQAAASQINTKPIFRFSIEGYSRVFVYRPTSRPQEFAWITSINDWGVSVSPKDGSYTIDDLIVNVLDYGGAVTTDLSILLLQGRRCILQSGYDGLDLTDYATLFSGIVNTVTSNNDRTYSFTCNDYNRLNQRLIYLTGNTGTVTTTQTTYNASSPYTIITRLDVTNPITGIVTTTATATYAVQGPIGPTGTFNSTTNGVKSVKVVTSRVVTGVGGGNFTVYETTTTNTGFNQTVTITETYGAVQLYTNVIITTVTNQSLKLVTSTLSVTYTENGVLGTTTVTDAAVISSTNPRIVNGHPLDIMLDILLNQIGYATSDANITQIQNFRDTIFTGVEFYFVITGSVDAKDFIENQLLKPLAGYCYPNSLGQFCVGFAQPVPGGLLPLGAITPANLTQLPAINSSDLINVVSMRFDKNDSGVSVNTTISSTGYLAQADNFYTPSIVDLTDLSGQVAQEAATGASAVQGQLIIESDGMRSGFQGFLLSKVVSNALFAKYGSYNPTLQTATFWSGLFALEIGDTVTLTHPLLPSTKTGKIGIVNQLFQVIARSYDFASSIVTFTLEDASGINAFGSLRIAPNGKASFSAVSASDQARYLFMSGATGLQASGVAGGKLG